MSNLELLNKQSNPETIGYKVNNISVIWVLYKEISSHQGLSIIVMMFLIQTGLIWPYGVV